ncbi:hypothetical protein C5167_019467 [Papaver somniferum]|uniref:Sulfotransferase n=1 Tax=Papaver somniferum TaxID=3469 RepID=A0A4Y7IQS8_PAPSO|nr:cytosolic sulfotransferase 6-like [Papaver somniferum]RZC51037.1 hypothetical protein C5167_019467 [Papaver somniferum]
MASTQWRDSKLHGCEEADRKSTQKTSRDLLSSIPKQKAWMRSDHIYQYQNFWYGAAELQGVISMQRNFKALDTDLIVATYPKCGTTWLKALSFAIINRYHFNTATSKQHHPLLTNNPHLLLPFLDHVYSADRNPDLTCFSVNNRLLATHFPLAPLLESIKDSNCKLIYICRDPKDTFVSFWHFIAKIRTKNLENISLEEFCKQFCDGVVEYGSFWDHAVGYWKMSLQFPERVLFLKYEELKKEPNLHVIKLAEFLGYPFSAEEESGGVVEELLELCSFDHLSNLEVNKNGKLPSLEIGCNTFFRRGEVGDHVNYLTPAMIERLDKITEEKFLGYGLKLG